MIDANVRPSAEKEIGPIDKNEQTQIKTCKSCGIELGGTESTSQKLIEVKKQSGYQKLLNFNESLDHHTGINLKDICGFLALLAALVVGGSIIGITKFKEANFDVVLSSTLNVLAKEGLGEFSLAATVLALLITNSFYLLSSRDSKCETLFNYTRSILLAYNYGLVVFILISKHNYLISTNKLEFMLPMASLSIFLHAICTYLNNEKKHVIGYVLIGVIVLVGCYRL
ncbi:hypothetical protein [Vibrio harveyi]|uniref:hypothetical protein n=1 Tax=Vibrio harveyi TaxID=669 RepID=UPI000841D77C|nr:hypothetical protein [Vibrio harveyi]ODM57013.1 hypothetical protein BC455_18140 [Vibrio harveyi]